MRKNLIKKTMTLLLLSILILPIFAQLNESYAIPPPPDYIYVDVYKNQKLPPGADCLIDIAPRYYYKSSLFRKPGKTFYVTGGNAVDLYIEFPQIANVGWQDEMSANIQLIAEDGSGDSGIVVSNYSTWSNDPYGNSNSYRIRFSNIKPNTYYHFVYDLYWRGDNPKYFSAKLN